MGQTILRFFDKDDNRRRPAYDGSSGDREGRPEVPMRALSITQEWRVENACVGIYSVLRSSNQYRYLQKKIVALPSNFLFILHSLLVSDSRDSLNFVDDEATAPSYFTYFFISFLGVM